MKNLLVILIIPFILSCTANHKSSATLQGQLKALIIDGQNNHKVWPKSTFMMKQALEDSTRFTVDIYRTTFTWNAQQYADDFPLNDGKHYLNGDPVTDPQFIPDFSKYDVVISNFGWKAAAWPKKTQIAFEEYIKKGGGFVTIHAANNAFADWLAYNQMIGLGGWGGRNTSSGPYLYYDGQGQLIRDDSQGRAGHHGKVRPFQVHLRNTEHPIPRGLPVKWMHTRDELYNRLRGPALNTTVLATAFDDEALGGYGRHEPVLMAISFYEGRIFHSTLGHDVTAFESVGFITTLQRGAEWAASGQVTIPVPSDFPSETRSSQRPFRLWRD